MTRLKLIVLSVIAANTINLAHAAEGMWSLGAAAVVQNYAYKGVDNKVSPAPIIVYEGEKFYLHGFNAGYYLWNDKTDKLSVAAWYDPTHYRPKDSTGFGMRHLDYRKSTMMAGLSYTHFTQYGFLRTALGGDVLSENNGVVWDLGWLYRYTHGGLSIIPGIGATWSSENYNNYYYGVTRSESARTGIKHYSAGNDWNPYLELTVNYSINSSWNIYGMGRYTHLSHEAKDSPMVDSSWNSVLMTGFTYNF